MYFCLGGGFSEVWIKNEDELKDIKEYALEKKGWKKK